MQTRRPNLLKCVIRFRSDAPILAPLMATAIVVTVLLFTPTGRAQSVSPAAPEKAQTAQSSDQLAEVVVTAQHRQENLQDVPATITAMSGSFLGGHLVDSTFDIVSRVPNLTYSAFTRAEGTPTFRGSTQSADDAPGIDAPVAIFIDDVYQGRILNWDIASFDADQIEVLAGPQGTLFGRNVVGGAIDIITRKPTDEFEAGASVSTGNYSYLGARGYLSGPVAENLTARISMFSDDRSGYTTNLVDGQKLDGLDVKGGRAQLLYRNSEQFSYLLSTSLTKDNSYGEARGYLGAQPTAPALAGLVDDHNTSTAQDANDGGVHIDTGGITGTGNWKLTFADLVSISAYSTTKFIQPVSDIAGGPVPVLTESIDEHVRQFSQELRLVSPTQNERLKWVAGLYFINIYDRRNFTQTTYLYPGTFLGDTQYEIFGNNNAQSFNADMAMHTDSYAGYGQVTYAPVSRLNLTFGDRYSYDSKSGTIVGTGDSFVLLPSGPFNVAVSDHWSAFTPKATIDYHVTNDFMTYVMYSKGYKSGGYTDHGLDAAADFKVPLLPEYANNYEIGLKSEWLDHTLSANLTAYHVIYTALQVAEYEANGTFLVGNGDAIASGADLQLTARPVQNLETYLNYSYFSGHYTSFGANTGHQLSSPKDAFTAGFDYRWDVAGGYALVANGDVQHKSRYYIDANNDPALTVKYNAMVDASLSLEAKSGWGISVWGKNLTNEHALAYANDFSAFYMSTAQYQAGTTGISANYVPPLTWGISFSYKY
jgi:iron complex outermembrane receptor protein